jgi:hypothetical protein
VDRKGREIITQTKAVRSSNNELRERSEKQVGKKKHFKSQYMSVRREFLYAAYVCVVSVSLACASL